MNIGSACGAFLFLIGILCLLNSYETSLGNAKKKASKQSRSTRKIVEPTNGEVLMRSGTGLALMMVGSGMFVRSLLWS